MDFSVDFFRDEVRNGFYIPTAIKQGWAASLVVLDEIDRICRKHDINYFADWGSFLGAVRHGGFVPWDDDLDICMKREDYDKFRAVADIELPKEFVIHDYERKEDHQLFLARVVSNNRICFDEEHLKKYHNFPYMASVDIFILDYLYNDEDKERERCREIKRIIAVADGILEGSLHKDTIDRELYFFEQKYNIRIDRKQGSRHMMIELYKLAEKQMARAPKEGAERVGQIFPWVLKGGKGHPRKYYDNSIRVPFENTTIPIPAEYNAALRNHYGNYLVCRKVWGGHDYPYFEKQRENLQAVADFKLPEFTFKMDMLVRPDAELNKGDSLKGMAAECIKRLEVMTGQIVEAGTEISGLSKVDSDKEQVSGDIYKGSTLDDRYNYLYSSILEILPECQQLSVDLGTLIENVKGEESESARLVVDEIQKYCDALFEVYNLLTNKKYSELVLEKINAIEAHINSIEKVVTERIINREEILILTIGPKEWQGFEKLYDKLVKEDDADIYVVPLPVLFKDYFGQIIASDEELIHNTHFEDYPDNVKLSLWTDYNLGLHHPDRIYIQSPYDGENPCLTIPPQYYAKELRNYTDRLIYIPPYKTDEFGEKDYTDLCNLKHYVTAPGVIYADEVIVQSDNIKEQYVNKLIAFAGDETKAVWEDKLKIKDGCKADEPKKNRKKLFYLIGLNELSEHTKTNTKNDDLAACKTDIIESIKKRIEIFKENKETIDISVGLYPPDINIWNRVDLRLTKTLLDMLSTYGYEYIMVEPNNTELEKTVKEHDAYYGSASPLVTIFTYNKKPVMIADYDI